MTTEQPKAEKPAPGDGERAEVGEWVAAILAGSPLHDSLRSLAAHLRATGVAERPAVELLRALMDRSQARDNRPDEWRERRDDIPRLVRSADKFNDGTDTNGGLQLVDLSGFYTADIEPPRYVIEPLIPRGYTTLLGSHGGSGKSILGLTWAAHVACGRNWGPFRFERGKAGFVSLEDTGDLARYRSRRICEEYVLPPADVLSNLTIIDGTEVSALAVETTEYGSRRLMFTAAAERIREMAEGVDLVVIDNASDAFDANENERRLVRAFVRYLTSMVKGHGGAVLLLAHIDKAAARFGGNGNTYSGSTAWHNSTRSRLALVDDQLIHEKLNVGKKWEFPVPLAWSEHGVLVPDLDNTQRKASEAEQNEADDMAVTACLKAAAEAGETVTTATRGPVAAWHTLRQFPECPDVLKDKAGKTRAQEALMRLARTGAIRRVDYVDQYRNKRERWELTE